MVAEGLVGKSCGILMPFLSFLFFLALFVLRVRELRSLALDVSVDVSCRYRYIVKLAIAEKRKAEL